MFNFSPEFIFITQEGGHPQSSVPIVYMQYGNGFRLMLFNSLYSLDGVTDDLSNFVLYGNAYNASIVENTFNYWTSGYGGYYKLGITNNEISYVPINSPAALQQNVSGKVAHWIAFNFSG